MKDRARQDALWQAIEAEDVAALRRLAASKSRGISADVLFASLRHPEKPELLEILLEAGADPRTCFYGSTTLMTAAQHGGLAQVKALLARGADPHAVDIANDQTALDVAVEWRKPAIAKLLRDLGVEERARDRVAFAKALTRAWGGRADHCSGGVVLINPRRRSFAVQVVVRRGIHDLTVFGLRFSPRRPKGSVVSVNGSDGAGLEPPLPEMRELPRPFAGLDLGASRSGEPSADRDSADVAMLRAVEAEIGELALRVDERLHVVEDAIRLHAQDVDADGALRRRDVLERIAARLCPVVPPAPALGIEPVSLKRVRAKPAPHRFGGSYALASSCPACEQPLLEIARLDPSTHELAPLRQWGDRFSVPACLECWGPWTVDAESGRPATAEREAESWQERRLDLAPGARVAKTGDRIGGDPAWIQSDDTPECPACGSLMTFVLQLTSKSDASFGDGGRLYAFACLRCRVTTSLVQSH